MNCAPSLPCRGIAKATLLLVLAVGLSGCGERVLDIQLRLVTTSCPDNNGQVVNALEYVEFLEISVTGDGIVEPISTRSSVNHGTATLPGIPITGPGPEVRRRIDVIGRAQGPDGPIMSRGAAVVFVDDSATSMEVPVFLRRLDSFTFAASASEPETCSTMKRSRSGHTATVLTDGRVLIVGGALIETDRRIVHASAEIFDPKTGEFSMLEGEAAPRQPRVFHTATLLRDGRVLVAGGEYDPPDGGGSQPNRSAEIFDPKTDSFGAPIQMPRARTRHTATAVAGDMVVLVGGYSDLQELDASGHPVPTLTTDVFHATADGGVGAFDNGPDLPSPRAEHCALAVSDGMNVVIAGGKTVSGDEVVAAATMHYLRAWREERRISLLGDEKNMRTARFGLACGSTRREGVDQVVMAGGFRTVDGLDGGGDPSDNVEMFDPSAQQDMQNLRGLPGGARGWLCGAQLDRTSVAFIGGYAEGQAASATDRLVPMEAGPDVESVQGRLGDRRYHHRCAVLLDGSVLVTGGEHSESMGDDLSLSTAEIYTPRSLP